MYNLNRLVHQSGRYLSTHVPTKKLEGRVAIVTAGTCGLGFAISKRLGEDGAHVVVSSRREENVNRAVKELQDMGLKASGIPCHVSNPEARKHLLQSTADEYGGIDIFVQNAGVNPHFGNILDTPESALDKVYDVHIKSNFRFVQELVPYMEKREAQSSIVLTSSVTGFRSDLFPGAYAISKTSIFSMVKAFMPELTKRNIRINCLTFGVFKTAFIERVMEDKVARERYLSYTANGQFGETKDVEGIASYLCSDESSYVTGENFKVGGGIFMNI